MISIPNPATAGADVVGLIGAGVAYDDRCALEDGIFEEVGTDSDLAAESCGPWGVGGSGVPGPAPLAENERRNTDNCTAAEPSGGQFAGATSRIQPTLIRGPQGLLHLRNTLKHRNLKVVASRP